MARRRVMVEWTRDMDDAVGGSHIGDQVYRGRVGERAEMPAGAAEVLRAAGFVKTVTRQRSGATAPGTEPATPEDAPAAGFTRPRASSEQAAPPAP